MDAFLTWFSFFRDEHGNEVDLLIPEGRSWHAIEIKSSATSTTQQHFHFLRAVSKAPNHRHKKSLYTRSHIRNSLLDLPRT